jgi:diguanylate cyclase (GGDEF)-like protein
VPAALSRRLLILAALASAGLVFAAFLLYERPGLGIGHFYYLSIALAALAGGARLGALAGSLATSLYVAGVLMNTRVPSTELLTVATITRGFTYITIGALIGWFASRHRSLVAELRVLAERDVLTDLPNTRAFESAITRRLSAGRPFALLLADMDELKSFNRDEGVNAGNDALLRLADRLARSLGPEDDIARVGMDEFAMLVSAQGTDGAGRLVARLEQILADDRTKATLGWAAYPQEGDNALALYRAASERLYARKVMRGYLRPVRAPVDQAAS